MWVKLDRYMHKVDSINLHFSEKDWEVWITTSAGKGKMVYKGDEDSARELYSAMMFAIERNHPLFEVS